MSQLLLLTLQVVFWSALLLVFHVYVGYPVGVYLRAKMASRTKQIPQPEKMGSELPSVTVIIPAHNEERWIAHKIENVLELMYPRERLKVLVASDGCTDNTVSVAGQYVDRGVEVNHAPQRAGKMATLNRVISSVRSEIIVITDANALLSPDALKWLVRHFQDPQVGCVTGIKLCTPTSSSASEGEGLYLRYESWIKQSESDLGSCLGGNGQLMAVRKALFPVIPADSDDFYVPMKVLIEDGLQVRFERHAKAWIPAAAHLSQEMRRKVRTHVALFRNLPYLKQGLNPAKSRIWWGFLSHHVLRVFVPWAMLVSLLLSPLLWRAGMLYQVVGAAQGAFYLGALAGFVLEQNGIRVSAFYVPFYFVLANLAVLLAWGRWLRGNSQDHWHRTERIMPWPAADSHRNFT